MILRIFSYLLLIYICICAFLYFYQEKIIFMPTKLDKNFDFDFFNEFSEINLKTKDNKNLNALYFYAKNPKGLIIYLHGNAGNLSSWGDRANFYINLGFDVFMPDFRGYGKSDGKITSQKQLFGDLDIIYKYAKTKFYEDKIAILGYSLGTGFASYLAYKNNPKMLILLAPYFNLTYIMQQNYPLIPTFLLKYKINTNVFIENIKSNILIFHGKNDKIINHNSSIKLQKLLKKDDKLILLENTNHDNIKENLIFQEQITKALNYNFTNN